MASLKYHENNKDMHLETIHFLLRYIEYHNDVVYRIGYTLVKRWQTLIANLK